MIDTEKLRAAVAKILGQPAAGVTNDTSLTPLATSLGRTRLRLALRHCGAQGVPNPLPVTFGQLLQAVEGDGGPVDSLPIPAVVAVSVGAVSLHQTANTGVRVGLDIELISSLPETGDVWSDDFYRETFAPSELAYAHLQAAPRDHLAGFWCAKEALRKCDAMMLQTPFAMLAVRHEDNGAPYLEMLAADGSTRLPHAVSISHAGTFAAAVVVLSA